MIYIIFGLVCLVAYFAAVKAFERGGAKYYGFSCAFTAVAFMAVMRLMAEIFFL